MVIVDLCYRNRSSRMPEPEHRRSSRALLRLFHEQHDGNSVQPIIKVWFKQELLTSDFPINPSRLDPFSSLAFVFLASFLGLFNVAELKDTTRILLWRDCPISCAVPQKGLEVRLSGFGQLSVIHFLNRSKLLNGHVVLILQS